MGRTARSIMADEQDNAAKKRTFRKFTYRGIDLERILELSNEELMGLVTARARRRFNRGMKRKPMALIKRLRKSKKNAPAHEKPDTGKTFITVEIKPEMVGHYLAEFSITYKPVRHGR